METVGEISQKEFNIEWSIKQFSLLSDEEYVYCSPKFAFANASWCFNIYPNEIKEDEMEEYEEYVCLFLRRESAGPPISMEYCLGIKMNDGKIDHEEHFSCIFNEKTDCGDDLLSKSQLFDRKSELLPLDTLTLVCRIKRLTFSECASKYIEAESYKPLRENKIFRDLKELFLKKDYSDVTIRVKEQEFSAHRNILAARSPVFESTFRNDMKEKETGIVDIEDCDPFTFSDFLCFLYCGDAEIVTVENVFSLFNTADKYDVSDLREMCLEFMKDKLCVNTFCDTITLALKYSETELLTLTTDFFMINAIKIAKTVKWQSYVADHPIQSNELFIKALEAAKDLKE